MRFFIEVGGRASAGNLHPTTAARLPILLITSECPQTAAQLREDPSRIAEASHLFLQFERSIGFIGNIGIMENQMEATIEYWGYRDNGKENGNYYSIFVPCWATAPIRSNEWKARSSGGVPATCVRLGLDNIRVCTVIRFRGSQ